MKGFNYTSYLTYSYSKQINEMRQILEFDGYKSFEINEQENLIKYSIFNERVIKLNYFLYLYKIKYVKVTIAQMIQLCLEIVLKYMQIQQNSIQHNYLQTDRVLIVLDTKQESLSIFPTKFHYKIHFTGYDCPFYERQDYQNYKINDQDAIQLIVGDIIYKIQNYKKKQDLKLQSIIHKLKTSINQSFNVFIQEINKIQEEYSNLNNQNQKLDYLDKQFENMYFQRTTRKSNVKENIQNLKQQFYVNDNWQLYEFYLYQTLPLITKDFRKAMYYSQQKPPKDLLFINIANQFKSYDQDLIKNLIEKEIENLNKEFKFDWDLNNIQNEIKEIILSKFQLLQYFQNDFKYIELKDVDSKINQITQIKDNIAQKTIIQEIQNYLELKVLESIDQSI